MVHTEVRRLSKWDSISKATYSLPLDGSSEFQKINENTEPDELWCYKCEDQLPNRPAMKRHMHNEHLITIFEDIDIEKHGGFKWYRYPGKYYGH